MSWNHSPMRSLLPVAVVAVLSCLPLEAATLRVRMGTVAPRGSVWAEALEDVREEWREISNGEVELKVYPGGVLGDDPAMLRKMRAGTLQGVALSQIGLSRIDEGMACLSIPFMLRDDGELDYVRERLAPELERRLEARGFVLLAWGDAGWVRLFAKQPFRTPDDLRRMKLSTSAGDPDTERLWKDLGFSVVPLAMTDMQTALQTGMIEAVDVPPLFALLDRTYQVAGHMLDVKVAPLVGGIVIGKETWEQIPQRFRQPMMDAARRAGKELESEVRRLDSESIVEMKQRGLQVIPGDAEVTRLWSSEAESTYPRIRGVYAPADLWDRVVELVKAYRSGGTPGRG